ncbi:carboxylesterase family protein [Nocardia sp. CA-128927]|uniref:carboxylesterase family protein n=1 Tax=Nocardia sp. CA-128927 TaxID=3239975 RepID=UPI003D96D50A
MPTAHINRRTVLLGAAAITLAAACSTERSSSDTVRTTYGPIRGKRRDTGIAFLGVPFARPPVGELRFAAPAPPAPWTETLECTAYGPTAQRRSMGEVTTIPEPSIPGDAVLNLNVFTPDPSARGLPVLVWIHGGGFIAGSPASPWYDGAAFNRDGVVVVSVGYRLGIDGFLHLDGAPDNRAVLDWIAALQWVRDNVASFGGDPGKVTVAGQSAGGGAVWALMATPAARGLFRAGISVSGAVTQPNDRAAGLAVAELFTRRTGVPATAAALRALPENTVLDMQDALQAPGPGSETVPMLGLAPFADGTLIPESTPTMLKNGAGGDIPLLLGFTRHEFNMAATMMAQNPGAASPLAGAGRGVDMNAYRAAYPGAGEIELAGHAISDTIIRGPSYQVAEARARLNQPTWLYEFTWTSTAPGYNGMAAHCLDLPFAFDLLRVPGVTEVEGAGPPQALADAMHAAWVGFVKDNAPGANWPRYTLDKRQTMIWSNQGRVESDPFAPQRQIWAPLYCLPSRGFPSDMVGMFTYVVTAEFANDEVRQEYLAWMRDGHVAKVVELSAAVSGQVVLLDDGRVEGRYVFPDRETFTAYETGPAVALRADGARFTESGKVVFARSTGEVLFGV